MSGTTQNASDVEIGNNVVGVEPTIDSESASEAYPVEVAEELATALTDTTATKIRIIGHTLVIRSATETLKDTWEIHRTAIDTVFEWNYRSVNPENVDVVDDSEWASVFRLSA